jgi:hypothetical protein
VVTSEPEPTPVVEPVPEPVVEPTVTHEVGEHEAKIVALETKIAELETRVSYHDDCISLHDHSEFIRRAEIPEPEPEPEPQPTPEPIKRETDSPPKSRKKNPSMGERIRNAWYN